MNRLIEFSISNFRGIVSFHAEPNGKSVELRGRNRAGKSSCVDALWFGMGGKLEGDIVHHGADKAKVEIVFGDYRITRTQTGDKPPVLTVKSADGKAKFNSPTELLSEFVGAIQRQTFSAMPAKQQAEILKRLAPEIDTTALDGEYAQRFAERTNVNRDCASLTAQAAGVVIPSASVEAVPPDVDIAVVAGKKTEAEKHRARKTEANRVVAMAIAAEDDAKKNRIDAITILENARIGLVDANKREAEAIRKTVEARDAMAALPEPIDTAAIDEEIRQAKITNDLRAEQRRQADRAKVAKEQRDHLEKQAKAKEALAARITQRLDQIKADKAAQLASAKLPVPGLAITDGAVTLDGVELPAVNTASLMRLDVVIAAELGHGLIAIRNASLIDEDGRAKLAAFADEKGIQVISEIVVGGQPLTAEILEREE